MRNSYYLMRHGESQANRRDLIVSDPAVGCRDYGLTRTGREQAFRAASESALPPDTVIVSSDFKRTLETADAAREALGAGEVIAMEGLRERFFGELDGCSGERYHEVWALDEADPDHTTFGVEPASKLARRLQAVMAVLEERFERQTLLLVSHGDTLRFLQLVVARRPLTEHLHIRRFGPAEIRALDELPPSTS